MVSGGSVTVTAGSQVPVHGRRPIAFATSVATSPRRGEMGAAPRGWTELASRTMYVSEDGSIHRVVPVKPVWPKLPMGNALPRGREYDEVMSQPKPRCATPFAGSPSGVKVVAVFSAVGGCSGVVMSLSVDCLSGNGPVLCSSLSSSAWAYLLTSSAVEKTPACPATPDRKSTRL